MRAGCRRGCCRTGFQPVRAAESSVAIQEAGHWDAGQVGNLSYVDWSGKRIAAAAADPARLTLTRDGRQLHAIYRVSDDDALILCINTEGELPENFEAARSVKLYRLQRDSAERRVAAIKSVKIKEALQQDTAFEFVETPLPDVVAFLGDLHGINIVIDADALAAAGISTDVPITSSQESGIPFDTALRMMLPPLGLRYEVRGSKLVITAVAKR